MDDDDLLDFEWTKSCLGTVRMFFLGFISVPLQVGIKPQDGIHEYLHYGQ